VAFAMIGVLIMLSGFFIGLGVWLLGIRRYLSGHGGTVITGATWWLSAWADWQQCRDFARSNDDMKASALASAFLITQIILGAGIVAAVCGK
jgi:hypothetical protein